MLSEIFLVLCFPDCCLSGLTAALDSDITSWGGTIVTPGMLAYSKEEHKKQDMAAEEVEEGQKEAGEEAGEEAEEKMES